MLAWYSAVWIQREASKCKDKTNDCCSLNSSFKVCAMPVLLLISYGCEVGERKEKVRTLTDRTPGDLSTFCVCV